LKEEGGPKKKKGGAPRRNTKRIAHPASQLRKGGKRGGSPVIFASQKRKKACRSKKRSRWGGEVIEISGEEGRSHRGNGIRAWGVRQTMRVLPKEEREGTSWQTIQGSPWALAWAKVGGQFARKDTVGRPAQEGVFESNAATPAPFKGKLPQTRKHSYPSKKRTKNVHKGRSMEGKGPVGKEHPSCIGKGGRGCLSYTKSGKGTYAE